MAAPFKIPKRSGSEARGVQMTSPLSRLQGPDAVQSFSAFRPRPLSGTSCSSDSPGGTNSSRIDLRSRLGPRPAELLSNGWRPKRASDRLLSPVSVSEAEKKKDCAEKSPSPSGPSPLRPISVRSTDALAALRAERHHGSSTPKAESPLSWSRVNAVPSAPDTAQSEWSDLSDVREKQREKWRQFKEKKQNRSNATIRTQKHDPNQTKAGTTASSEPIVLSSEEEEEEEEEDSGAHRLSQSEPPQERHVQVERPPPPSFLQLDFRSFHLGLSSARANGKIMITESGITVPLKGCDGAEVELCVVATQIQAFGLWDGGVARGGTLFADSARSPSGPAPSLLFLSVTDAQSKLLQMELREIQPHDTGPLCSLLLLELEEQLSDLDSALVLSVLDSGDYRKSRSGPGSGSVDWSQGLVLVHSCPSPVDSHLLQLLGQKSSAVRTRNGLRSAAQHMPSRLIQYPPAPSKGRISVSSEDLLCLQHGQFLNDVIIDFYLKYLLLEGVGGAVAERSHVFSSFFYKQLSKRRAAGEDAFAIVPDRHTRHQRVRTWTRNVDIFNKDFLFIPVNQESHWFLVLVCFPGLEQPEHEEFSPSSETLRPGFGLRSQTPPECTMKGCRKSSVLKRACVLVMDSLRLSQQDAVCRLIRDYLQVEWEVRRGSKRLFSPDAVKTIGCRVPQQDNSSDCGLYLLQYAQAFLQNPVVDFAPPLRLDTWFPRQRVRDKRDEIKSLVLRLHRDQGLNQD